MKVKIGDFLKKTYRDTYRIYKIIDISEARGVVGMVIVSNYKTMFQVGTEVSHIKMNDYFNYCEILTRDEIIMELL